MQHQATRGRLRRELQAHEEQDLANGPQITLRQRTTRPQAECRALSGNREHHTYLHTYHTHQHGVYTHMLACTISRDGLGVSSLTTHGTVQLVQRCGQDVLAEAHVLVVHGRGSPH